MSDLQKRLREWVNRSTQQNGEDAEEAADALDAQAQEIARLTAELAQTQRDRQAEHDLRVTMQGEAETLRARLAAAERDAERFVWLTEDHAGAARHMRNSLLERMAVMSTSAVRAAVDAARGGA